MKKAVLLLIVILLNVSFISCETDDDLYQNDIPLENTMDDEDEILPPRGD